MNAELFSGPGCLFDGAHLRAARIMAGLTQRQLAEAADLHPKAVAYWERDIRAFPAGGAIDAMIAALAYRGVRVRCSDSLASVTRE
jgi:transcriptional regulator with XRE-family HTH domain